MESIIDSKLEEEVPHCEKSYYENNKEKYIAKVIETIYAKRDLVDYESLLDLIYGMFTYKYINIESGSVDFLLNEYSMRYAYWNIHHKYHKYLALINKKSKILTYDSYHAHYNNKAGISGFIRGKNIVELQNYIMDHCDGKIIMWSAPVVDTYQESTELNKLMEKYNITGPMYIRGRDILGDYQSFYGDIHSVVRSYTHVLMFFVFFDIEVLNAGNVSLDSARRNILESLKNEDLYSVSFLGNKLNDNTLFKLLSKFEPKN